MCLVPVAERLYHSRTVLGESMLESFHPLGGREFKMVVTLKAKIRDAFGKEKVKKLRAEGGLPAVAYGPGLEEPLHLVLDLREAQKTITPPRVE